MFEYKASMEGKVPTAPAEENLKLKKGARVVVIANIYQEEDEPMGIPGMWWNSMTSPSR